MKKTASQKNAIFFMLLTFIGILIFYGYKKNQDYQKLSSVFIEDKKEMQNELNEIIEDYENLNVEKKGLSKRLLREMNKIIALRDSIKELKDSNFNLIRKYRRRIRTLERENRDLFAKVDSLGVVNNYLKNNNLEIAKKLEDKETENQKLQGNNTVLKKEQDKLKSKLKIAEIVKTGPVNAIVMKERKSGKLTSTSRSSRADVFKVQFKLLSNKVTTPGKKKLYVQIVDTNNNIIAAKGKTNLVDGKELVFSDELTADYRNDEIDVLSLILVNRDDIHKGVYQINIFVEGRLTGTTSVKLR